MKFIELMAIFIVYVVIENMWRNTETSVCPLLYMELLAYGFWAYI